MEVCKFCDLVKQSAGARHPYFIYRGAEEPSNTFWSCSKCLRLWLYICTESRWVIVPQTTVIDKPDDVSLDL